MFIFITTSQRPRRWLVVKLLWGLWPQTPLGELLKHILRQ
jgi:hypothetical protein